MVTGFCPVLCGKWLGLRSWSIELGTLKTMCLNLSPKGRCLAQPLLALSLSAAFGEMSADKLKVP